MRTEGGMCPPTIWVGGPTMHWSLNFCDSMTQPSGFCVRRTSFEALKCIKTAELSSGIPDPLGKFKHFICVKGKAVASQPDGGRREESRKKR